MEILAQTIEFITEKLKHRQKNRQPVNTLFKSKYYYLFFSHRKGRFIVLLILSFTYLVEVGKAPYKYGGSEKYRDAYIREKGNGNLYSGVYYFYI